MPNRGQGICPYFRKESRVILTFVRSPSPVLESSRKRGYKRYKNKVGEL
jgi:hypothetical protein